MTDIFDRLRRTRCDGEAGCNTFKECACCLLEDAALEIERLRAALKGIVTELGGLAKIGDDDE
jgi:hypothetical protein